MTKRDPFIYFHSNPEVIYLAMMLYMRFPLALWNVEDLLNERGIDVSHEAIWFGWNGLARCSPLRSDVTRAFN